MVWLAALATLGAACDRQEQHPRVDAVAHSDTLPHPIDSGAKRVSPDSSATHDGSAVTEVVDSLVVSPDTIPHRPQRFGIVDFERGFGPCLAIAKDSVPVVAGTEVALVNIGDEYDEKRSPQHLARVILLGPVDSSCGDPSAFSEPAYRLRVTTGKAADGFGERHRGRAPPPVR